MEYETQSVSSYYRKDYQGFRSLRNEGLGQFPWVKSTNKQMYWSKGRINLVEKQEKINFSKLQPV